ncbi:phosphatase PAP2 family protein [Aspergillus chevalieri]|uniref:Phosphatidic acid phosphatase type 2/haloperoxidase domain-containing protein n=1 Tax=Aspergillus chevalieri TaxID=182096 RepID=A0A7R7VEA9_ASPCH|nr:uncharacterized protein ACHE_10622S [Aspergillus chevalieri]BCR83220.1 hypothetical protein ACHE_10622S [Aspergillus chevalieri]
MDHLPSKLPFSKRRLRPRIIISYILDYVILVACIVGFYILDSVEPFHQPFSLENISLKYPYAVHETIPMPAALCISGLIPLVTIAIYTLFVDGLFSHNKPRNPASGKKKLTGPYRLKDRLWEFNCGFLGLLLSQGLAFVITQVLKNACGKPRPDIIDRCQPNVTQDPQPFGLSNYTICTGDPEILKDGFKSWPSGHSSSSFAGLFYLSLWLSGKLHIMDNRGEAWKSLLVMVPILGAMLVAVTRIMDARHHPFDVITGSFLGIVCASVSYRQYFPSLSEPWKKGRAYPIRTWGSEPANPFDDSNRPPSEYRESTAALRNPTEERLGESLTVPPAQEPPRYPTPSAYSTPTPVNPYTHNTFHQRRQHEHDGDWSSSSEDLADGYEMQHGYMRTQNPGLSTTPLPQYEVDTSYHRPTEPPMVPGVSALHSPPGVVTSGHGRA